MTATQPGDDCVVWVFEVKIAPTQIVVAEELWLWCSVEL